MKIQLCPFSLQLPDLVLCKNKPLSKNLTLPHALSYSFLFILPSRCHPWGSSHLFVLWGFFAVTF